MTATPMRSKEMMKRYFLHTQENKNVIKKYPPFEDPSEKKIAEFKHFFIVENYFPYDTIATKHHMIVSKRNIPLDMNLLNDAEKDELEKLKEKDGYIGKNYDVFFENLPFGRTIPSRFHLHLAKLIREEKEGIDTTFLREKETMKAYQEHMAKKPEDRSPKGSPFNRTENIIKEFKFWRIVGNDFPYDAVAMTNHMICTKRQTPFLWSELNNDEKKEFYVIKKSYLDQHYDVLYENLASAATKPGWFHLHLLKLKRFEIDADFLS